MCGVSTRSAAARTGCGLAAAWLLAAVVMLPVVQRAAAQELQVPPPATGVRDFATDNIRGVVSELRKHGSTKQADWLERQLKDGQIYYRDTGKLKESGQAVQAGDSPDGKMRLYLPHHSVGEGRNTGIDGEKRKYSALLVTLHEFVHFDQPVSFIQKGNAEYDTKGYRAHELEAYQKSLKQFVDGYISPGLNDFIAQSANLPDADKAARLADLDPRLHTLFHKVAPFVDDEDLAKEIGDRTCRWKAIKKAVGRLYLALRSLRADAESRAACSEAGRESREKFERDRGELSGKIADILQTRTKLQTDVARARKEAAALRAEMGRSRTNSARRRAIADRLAVVDPYLRTESNRLKEVAAEHDAMTQRRATLTKNFQFTSSRQAEQCRLDFVKSSMSGEDFNGSSDIPPDMTVDSAGNPQMLPPGKAQSIDVNAMANELKELFNYDPDKLKQSQDPRTPCPEGTIRNACAALKSDMRANKACYKMWTVMCNSVGKGPGDRLRTKCIAEINGAAGKAEIWDFCRHVDQPAAQGQCYNFGAIVKGLCPLIGDSGGRNHCFKVTASMPNSLKITASP